jgi:hypothetical protein
MRVFQWVSDNWPSLLQNLGIVGGLLFSAYSTWKNARSRQISNLIAITEQYRDIWGELYTRPELARVLERNVDLLKQPISREEELFVNLLLQHLDTVRHAMKVGMFVRLDGLRKDVQDFLSLPIPRAVFEKNKPFHNQDFIKFINACLLTQ